MKQKGAGSQCVRRTNIGSLSFRERYLSLRKRQSARVAFFASGNWVLMFFQSLWGLESLRYL